MKKISIYVSVLDLVFILTVCGMIINITKNPGTDRLKSALQTQKDVVLNVIPNVERTLNINNKYDNISNINNKDDNISNSASNDVKTFINSVKKPVTDGIKTVIQIKNDVIINIIPNGDRTLNINIKY